MDDRIIQIEEKLAHLEKYVNDLDTVVQTMQGRMDGIRAEVARAFDRLEQLEQDDEHDGDPADDKPPHW